MFIWLVWCREGAILQHFIPARDASLA